MKCAFVMLHTLPEEVVTVLSLNISSHTYRSVARSMFCNALYLIFSAVRGASWGPKVAWPKSVFTTEEEASDSKRPVRSNFCMSAHSKHSQVLTKKIRFLRLAFPLLSTLFVLLTTELHHFKKSTIWTRRLVWQTLRVIWLLMSSANIDVFLCRAKTFKFKLSHIVP